MNINILNFLIFEEPNKIIYLACSYVVQILIEKPPSLPLSKALWFYEKYPVVGDCCIAEF